MKHRCPLRPRCVRLYCNSMPHRPADTTSASPPGHWPRSADEAPPPVLVRTPRCAYSVRGIRPPRLTPRIRVWAAADICDDESSGQSQRRGSPMTAARRSMRPKGVRDRDRFAPVCNQFGHFNNLRRLLRSVRHWRARCSHCRGHFRLRSWTAALTRRFVKRPRRCAISHI